MPMFRGRPLLGWMTVAATLALTLPACGNSTQTTGSPPKQTTSTKPAPPRTTIGTLPVITETTLAPVPATVAPGPTTTAPANSAPAWFLTPTGNIGCRIDGDSIRCDIKQAYKAVRAAADCTATSTTRNRTKGASTVPPSTGMPTFEVKSNAAKGEAGCASESVMGGEKVRRYPARASVGSNSCDITKDGVECRNGGGHGFFLSKEEYRLF